eukprot:1796461-Rhodomonas_salina.1
MVLSFTPVGGKDKSSWRKFESCTQRPLLCFSIGYRQMRPRWPGNRLTEVPKTNPQKTSSGPPQANSAQFLDAKAEGTVTPRILLGVWGRSNPCLILMEVYCTTSPTNRRILQIGMTHDDNGSHGSVININ